ncbi:WD40-repeat-containing domain protein [Zopfochytrium polystomum]|nr:WD40-repeat-containing domain protein [Zopfochytrium polystomum]
MGKNRRRPHHRPPTLNSSSFSSSSCPPHTETAPSAHHEESDRNPPRSPDATATDLLSRLPAEIADRILAHIPDYKTVCRLACVSKLWSTRTAADDLWRSLFLARWNMPRRAPTPPPPPLPSAAPTARGPSSDVDIAAFASATQHLQFATLHWKMRYKHRQAIDRRWRRGNPVIRLLPLRDAFFVAVHPDLVVAAHMRTGDTRLMRRSDWTCVATLKGHDERVFCADVSADATAVLTGSVDMTVRKWDTATGRCTMVLRGHQMHLRRVSFVGNGAFVFSVCFGSNAKVWDAASGALIHDFPNDDGRFCDWNVAAAAAANGDRLVSLETSAAVKIWNMETGQCDRVVVPPRIAISPVPGNLVCCGNRVAVSWLDASVVRVWDLRTGALLATVQAELHDASPTDLEGNWGVRAGADAVEILHTESDLIYRFSTTPGHFYSFKPFAARRLITKHLRHPNHTLLQHRRKGRLALDVEFDFQETGTSKLPVQRSGSIETESHRGETIAACRRRDWSQSMWMNAERAAERSICLRWCLRRAPQPLLFEVNANFITGNSANKA